MMNWKPMLFALLAATAAFAQTKTTTETRITVTASQSRTTAAESRKAGPLRRVALIVQNHTEHPELPLSVMKAALKANLSGRGMQLIDPSNMFGSNQNRSGAGEPVPPSSALGLARKLGAEGMLTATIASFQDRALGTPTVLHQYSIRLEASLADVGTGGEVAAAMVVRTSQKYTNNQIAQNRGDYLERLVADAAEECARQLAARASAAQWRPTPRPKPKAPAPPATILDQKVDILVREMLQNPSFVRNYGECKARLADRLPVAVLGGIANLSGDAGAGPLLEAAGERFRMRLFNTKLFEVKDDGVLVALGRRIVESGNSLLEDGELMNALKRHGSPDFFVAGDLKRLTDLDGVRYYKLRLAIHNLSTGRTVWEGIETFTRKGGAAQ